MKKRQFGKGRDIIASEHNLAQNYTISNLQEIVQDIGLFGIVYVSKDQYGVEIPITSMNNAFNISIPPMVCRDYIGNRINIPTSVVIDTKIVGNILANEEVYVTVYATHVANMQEQDIDEDDLVYYKDYTDNYVVLKAQGPLQAIGAAEPIAVPAGGVLIADILINGTTTVLTSANIKTNRQIRFTDEAGSSLNLSGDLNVQGSITGHDGINLSSGNLSLSSSPIADAHVGSRGYNDNRYLQKVGGVMLGDIEGPSATIQTFNAGTIVAAGTSNLKGVVTAEQGIIVTGNSSVAGDFTAEQLFARSGANIDGRVVARSFYVEWYNSKLYQAGTIVTNNGKLWQVKEGQTHTSVAAPGTFINDISRWRLAGGGGSTTQDVNLVNHGFFVGQILRFFGGQYILAKADAGANLGLFIISDVADNDNFTIMQTGYLKTTKSLINALQSGSATFTPDAWYYLSDTQAGKLVTVSPSISQPILYAISDTEAYVMGYRPENAAFYKVDEFTYELGKTEYTLSFNAEDKDSLLLIVGGVPQSNADYDVNSKTLTLHTVYPEGAHIRAWYISTLKYAPGAALEEYKELTTEIKNKFTLENAPISVRHLLITINGQGIDSDDYSILGFDVTLNFNVPAGQKVRIINICAARLLGFNPDHTPLNSIPGDRMMDNTIAASKVIDGHGSGLDADTLDLAEKSIDGTLSTDSDLKIPTEKALRLFRNLIVPTEFSVDHIILDTERYTHYFFTGAVANRAFTLPTLADNLNKSYTFFNWDSTYMLTIDGEGSETIDGMTTIQLPKYGNNITVIATSTEWKIINESITSYCRFSGYAGYGGTDTMIMRFTTMVENVGNMHNENHSTGYSGNTKGLELKANRKGKFSYMFSFDTPATACMNGLTLNSTTCSTSLFGITDVDVILSKSYNANTYFSYALHPVIVDQDRNAIVRPHTDGVAASTNFPALFRCTYLGQ